MTDKLTYDDLKELYMIADSFMSSGWIHEGKGRIVNCLDARVANFVYASDAEAMSRFTPEILLQLCDLAVDGLL